MSINHVVSVRPHWIFDRVPQDAPLISLPTPMRNNGSLTVLESFLLISLARSLNARRIFEIGTFHGLTARNLVRNVEGAEIFTLDLVPCDFVDEPRIHAIRGHSVVYRGQLDDTDPLSVSSLWATFDLVLVDGGHDYETVVSDSGLAFALVDRTRPSAIVWHDFGNPQYPDVERAVRELHGSPVYTIEETQLAVLLTGK